jgi:hypothetical protein
MTECSICCEKFNKSNHLKVECKGCNEEQFACRTCAKTYIVTSTKEPSCLFCKSGWDREFMNQYLTKKFVDTELKDYTENLFYEEQVSLLPSTQHLAIKQKKINDIYNNIADINTELNKIRQREHELKETIRAFHLQIYRINEGHISVEETKNNFTIKCPNTDCKGFLNTTFKCSLCDKKYCKDCYEELTEDHVCNEELKETVKAIKKDSKPCPGCGERISKIDGCDQMWCVTCHIQFSWKTGNQLTGYNHNPEYFRWLRESGQQIERNPQDIMNGGDCDMIFNVTAFNNIVNDFPITNVYKNYIMAIYRCFLHMRHHTEPRDETKETTLRNFRVKYLLKEITDAEWKKNIFKINKQHEKSKEISNVYAHINLVLRSKIEMFVLLGKPTTLHTGQIYKILSELSNFKDYINARFLAISNTYKSTTCPGIGDDWREMYNYKAHIKKKREKTN